MEYRLLGGSGLKVSALSFGTATFGGTNEFFKGFGETEVEEARRMIDICFEAGVNLFDTADGYSDGRSEEILGKALAGKRHKALISTKTGFPTGPGPNEEGSSRYHLRPALEASLRRLGTDYIDIYHLHCFDAMTPIEEVQDTLNKFVREGKVRYIACSNFSGWHLMKSLAVADRYGWTRFVAHQVYYSLIGREYEWELMPLALDQKVGALVWSPLGWGRLTGKIRRGQPLPESEPVALDRRRRTANARRISVWGGGRAGKCCDRDRKDGSAGGAELAVAEADGFFSDYWRAERGAVAAESGIGGLESDCGTSCGAG